MIFLFVFSVPQQSGDSDQAENLEEAAGMDAAEDEL